MAKKGKISIRKVLQVFTTFVVALSCIIAIVSAARIEDNKLIKRVQINIFSDKKYHSIEEKQILDETINFRNIDILNTPVSKLDMQSMEHVLKADPWVADAQLFVDNNMVLHMLVTQRIPVARFFDNTGNSYYIDTTMSTMPLSTKFVCYTSVVTNVPVFGTDSLGWALKKEIVSMVRYIQADSFWSAQISQIVLNSDYTFELVPVIGDQRIIFGDTSRMKEKFNDLYLFYKNVFSRIGWDWYKTLDLRFKNQVVATPPLPYKGPVDKAVANMNWVNSIVETEARKDSARASAEAMMNDDEPEKEPVPAKKVVDVKADKKDSKIVVHVADKKDEHAKGAKPVAHAAKKEDKKERKEDKKESKKDIKKETKKADAHDAKKQNAKQGEHENKDKNKGKQTVKYTYPENKNH